MTAAGIYTGHDRAQSTPETITPVDSLEEKRITVHHAVTSQWRKNKLCSIWSLSQTH